MPAQAGIQDQPMHFLTFSKRYAALCAAVKEPWIPGSSPRMTERDVISAQAGIQDQPMPFLTVHIALVVRARRC